MSLESISAKNSVYNSFKSYANYQNGMILPSSAAKNDIKNNEKSGKKSPSIKQSAFVGASVGTVLAMVLSGKIPALLSKITSKEIKKDSILNDYLGTIVMALGANVGGVIGGGVNTTKEQKTKKIKEGAFQIMNIAIPMTFVTAISALCKNVKALNNNPCKIIGSVAGMVSGAYVATKITNATKEKGEADRKYTLKDATANFDDIVATIKIGFKDLAKKIPVDTILPFIYVFAGSRAGSRE